MYPIVACQNNSILIDIKNRNQHETVFNENKQKNIFLYLKIVDWPIHILLTKQKRKKIIVLNTGKTKPLFTNSPPKILVNILFIVFPLTMAICLRLFGKTVQILLRMPLFEHLQFRVFLINF
jgi:hypothetical protein